MRYVGTRGSYPTSARLMATVLFAVVLAHLAYMASPLHWRPATIDELHAVASTSLVDADATALLDASTGRDSHADDCTIEWLALDKRVPLAMLLTTALAAVQSWPHLPVSAMRPIARAIGPPSAGDPQALLQVFRL